MVQDIDVDLSNTDLNSQQKDELQRIADGCGNVLADIEKTVERYSQVETNHGLKRAWKRLKWEPDDVRDLRNRVCSNVALLNAMNWRITRDSIQELLKHKTNEQHQKYLDWLSPTNYAVQQRDFIGRRQPGTGEWLLD